MSAPAARPGSRVNQQETGQKKEQAFCLLDSWLAPPVTRERVSGYWMGPVRCSGGHGFGSNKDVLSDNFHA